MKWRVGEITVTSIYEQDLHELALIMPDATAEVVKAVEWLSPHFATADGHMTGIVQAFVIETPECKVVVDTCVGNDKVRVLIEAWHLQQRSFLEKFESAGYKPQEIDYVLCTHMHFDHVGWNTTWNGKSWEATFPNARYLFAETEYKFWQEELLKPPISFEKANEEDKFEAGIDAMTRETHADSIEPIVNAGLADFVPVDHQVASGVRLIPTHGHTPGHVSVVIESQGSCALITGDAIHHPVQIAHPDMATTVDIDPLVSPQTRRNILEDAVDQNLLVIGTHFSEPTAGYISKDKQGYRLEVPTSDSST